MDEDKENKSDQPLAVDLLWKKELLEKKGLKDVEAYKEIDDKLQSKISASKDESGDEYSSDDSFGSDDSDTSGESDTGSEGDDSDDSAVDDESSDEDGGEEPDESTDEEGDDGSTDDVEEDSESSEDSVTTEALKSIVSLDGHLGHDRLVLKYRSLAAEADGFMIGYNGLASGWHRRDSSDDSSSSSSSDSGSSVDWGGLISDFYGGIKSVGSATGDFLKEYGGPAASALGEGFAAAGAATMGALFGGIETIARFGDDSHKSFESLKKEINRLKSAVDRVGSTNKQALLGKKKYRKKGDILALSIGNKHDPITSIKSLDDFSKVYFSVLSEKVKANVLSVKHIIDVIVKDDNTDPLSLLYEDPSFSGFNEKTTRTYKAPNENMTCYIYDKLLPGNRLLVGYFPKEEISDPKDIHSAYAQSKLFLGIDNENMKGSDVLDYYEAGKLKTLLNLIEEVVDTGIKSSKVYDEIVKERESLKVGFKNYMKAIVQIRNSGDTGNNVKGYVGDKAEYLDKTFIGGSMKVHGYISNTVESALEFVRANVKALS